MLIDQMIAGLQEAHTCFGKSDIGADGHIGAVVHAPSDINTRDLATLSEFVAPTTFDIVIPRGRPLAVIEREITAIRRELCVISGGRSERCLRDHLQKLDLERVFAIFDADVIANPTPSPEAVAEKRLAKRDARNGGTDIRYTMADGSIFEGL